MNILRGICEVDAYKKEQLDVIDQELLPLYKIIEENQTKFDDDIVYLVTQLIKRSKSVTLNQMNTFFLIDKFINRQQGHLNDLFPFLNMYLKWGGPFMWNCVNYQH